MVRDKSTEYGACIEEVLNNNVIFTRHKAGHRLVESAWFSASLPCLQAAWSQPPRTASLLLSVSHRTFQSPISESPAPWPPSLPSCSSHLGSLSGLSLSPSTPRCPLGSLHHPPSFLFSAPFPPITLNLLQFTPLSRLFFLLPFTWRFFPWEEGWGEEEAGNEQRERTSQMWFRQRETGGKSRKVRYTDQNDGERLTEIKTEAGERKEPETRMLIHRDRGTQRLRSKRYSRF